ncbi:hypothetical protein [Oceanicola sp. 502str15]|uniref:hypothetical protein n=1 Tax=Oceanicola sp. 502str15 TaxID=2696061 RepID=UPI0020941CCA|nr:hypothetical protein [Oceanicola sp. 502str15]MCO6381407.1 hypothetical protein [Oceanicola sp. 502str15]
MARTDRSAPHLVHRQGRFVVPGALPRREQGQRQTDTHSKHIMRAVRLLGDAPAPKAKEPEMTVKQDTQPKNSGGQVTSMIRPRQPRGVEPRDRGGIWKMQVDGKHPGGNHQAGHALAAAALHELAPQ